MPGICGIVGVPSSSVDRPLLAEMRAAMRHHPEDVTEEFEGPAALAVVHLPFAVAREASLDTERARAVISGELYNQDELRRWLDQAGVPSVALRSDLELLVHGVEHRGAEFLQQVDGKFSAAIWNRERRKLILITDKFGLKPLYYAQGTAGWLFASEIKALLCDPGVSRAQNVRGLAQFFSLGHFWNQDTFYQSIQTIPPATLTGWDLDSGALTFERYWRMEPNQELTRLDQREWIEAIDVRLKAVVDSQTLGTEHLGIALSGGLDARTILGLTDHRRAAMTCYSLGMEGSLDVQSARRLSQLAGYPYHVYTLDDSFLSQFATHLSRMVELTDGHYLSQCIVMPTFPKLREWGIQVLLRGHAGELMHLNKAYNFSLDQAAWRISDQGSLEAWLRKRLSAYLLEAVDGPLLAQADTSDRDALVRESLSESLKETAGWEHPINRISQLFVMQRLRRETALSLMKFQSVAETRIPFLDSRLIELLLSGPPRLRVGETIQASLLRHHAPEFLAPANSNTGARVGSNRFLREAALFRMKVLAKLGVSGFQPYERLGLWLRTSLRPLVEQILLAPECLDRGVFVPETVRRVVQQHAGNERNHTFLLLAMMIFEMGQRRFADHSEGDLPFETNPLPAATTH